MARFTDRDKWKDIWFRKLKPAEKLLWLYIVDTCDNAGFFELDVEMCSFVMKLDEERILGAIKGLSKGLIRCKETDHYYVKNFLKHQLNLPLTPANNAHKQIIRLIVSRKDDFPSIYKNHLPAIKGLISLPSKSKGKGNSKGIQYTEDFDKWWAIYRKGNKSNAFDAWKSQHVKCSEIIASTEKYISYCKSIDRAMLDGQGFINQRTFETEWTHAAQGTAPPIEFEKEKIDVII